jgi:hypothetical protein
VALVGTLAVGCSSDVEITAPGPTGIAVSQCRDLISQLPGHVAGQDARGVTPSDAPAAAWGDPAIVLRCGVDRPPALRPDSSCFVVNGVGWLTTQDGRPLSGDEPVTGEVVFTTIGRSAYVEVTVPPAYQPPADALVDLSSAISAATDDIRPCV